MAKSNESSLPPIEFFAAGSTADEQQENLDVVLPSPGFPTTAHLVADIIEKRSEVSVLDFSPSNVAVRFKIDNIWHSLPHMDRQVGDYLAATLKQLSGMNFRDRRNRQEGNFQILFRKKKTKIRVVSQGVATGERIAIFADLEKPETDNLEQCGMRPKMLEHLKQILKTTDPSLVLMTAIPGDGYTTAWRATLSAADRFMRDYYALEEASRVEPEVINVSSVTYDESKGETAMTPMPQLLLREPNVLVFPELADGEMIDNICELSVEQNLPIIARIPGKSAFDGLLRLLMHKPDVEQVVNLLQAIVSMRLIRRLCENCRVPFEPDVNLLHRLGIPVGRVKQLYQPFVYQPGMVDVDGNEIEVCPECQGLGYRHLTGLFELLTIDDDIRKAIRTTPRLDALTALARKKHHVSLREEGVVLVARGVTSLEELQRVLKK